MKSEVPVEETLRQRMRRFIHGELTLAEAEGMTWEQAQEIGKIGCELASCGRLEDARTIFEGLVAGNPKDTSAQAALGTVYQKLRRLDDALECYDAALSLFADNVVALANRGELRLRRGDKAGLADLARAVQLDPDGTSAAARRSRSILQALARVEAHAAPPGVLTH